MIVVGVRAWMIDHDTSGVPFYDQWDAEANELFAPNLQGQLTASSFFAPHNEHRIVLTRLLALGLFEANNKMWDPKLEMLVNSVIVGVMAVVIASLLIRSLPSGLAGKIWVAVALVWILPYGWENTLSGFQSQFYLMLLFSFLTLWGLADGPEFTPVWWVGAASAALSCLTMASGFFAPLVVLGLRSVTAWQDRPGPGGAASALRHHACTLALCLALTVLSLLGHHHVPADDVFQAQNGYQFLKTFAHALSWPLIRVPVAFAVLYLPSFWLVRGRLQNMPVLDRRLLAILAWVVLQAAAIAYARGAGGHMPSSRYMDILAIGCLANYVVLLRRSPDTRRLWRRLWFVLVAVGLIWQTGHELIHLPEKRLRSEEQLRRCREYVTNQDPRVLNEAHSYEAIPYPDPVRLRAFLDDSRIRPFLLFVPGQEAKAGLADDISNAVLRGALWILIAGLLLAGATILSQAAVIGQKLGVLIKARSPHA
jgi:hypothetical protein